MVRQHVVKYAGYRRYQEIRIETSNAMMGLLSGAGLAVHFLQLTDGSSSLLPDLFPRVPHIRRFNLSAGSARSILESADAHLGAMAVPYVLALHEEYLKSCIEILELSQLAPAGAARNSKLATQHRIIATATNGSFSATPSTQLTTLRRMRNCTIHSGGKADQVLLGDLARWDSQVESAWINIANRNPRNLVAGQVITFGYGEMLLALAVTKTLEREANLLLQGSLPREVWADMVVEEMADRDSRIVKTSAAIRSAKGIARQFYAPLSLTEIELQDAIRRYI